MKPFRRLDWKSVGDIVKLLAPQLSAAANVALLILFGNASLARTIAFVGILALALLGFFLFRVITKRSTSPLVGPKGQAIHTTQYSASARRLALILFCALPVLPVVSYATWSHLYGPRLIVLVTEPHGSQPERLQLCRTIAMDLETRLGAMSDVEVRRLCDPSAAPESAAAARTLGRLHRAAVVIWGTYQAGDCFAAQLRVDSMNILHS